MATVIGVRFKNAGKLYYFDPGKAWPTPGDAVIVETVRGVEYGEVVTAVSEVSDDLITPPLKMVIRVATAEDAKHAEENAVKEKEALGLCQNKIDEHKLQMKLVSCEYTFDNSKILFYFTSDKRVDFRALVKDLASIFHTRIELRQIGVRDEAKMMGGLGLCGRQVCCAAFLGDFQPVSIKMAKEQNLSLNPTKISGVCGRLMCCLKYEEDNYEETRKRMPKIGKEVITPDGNGMVVDLNILKEVVRVRIPKGDGTEQKDYPLSDVQRITPAKRSAIEDAMHSDKLNHNAIANDRDTADIEPIQDDGEDNAEVENTDSTEDVQPVEQDVIEFAQEEGVDPKIAEEEIGELVEPEHSKEFIEISSDLLDIDESDEDDKEAPVDISKDEPDTEI